MNEFGNDEKAGNEQDENNELIVPKPSVNLPSGFSPLVPGSALSDLEDLPESLDDEEDETGEEVLRLEDEDEVAGPDVESIFAKVVAEFEGEEFETSEPEGLGVEGAGQVGFTAPKVKPVMLSAASVYGASLEEEVLGAQDVIEDVTLEESIVEEEEVGTGEIGEDSDGEDDVTEEVVLGMMHGDEKEEEGSMGGILEEEVFGEEEGEESEAGGEVVAEEEEVQEIVETEEEVISGEVESELEVAGEEPEEVIEVETEIEAEIEEEEVVVAEEEEAADDVGEPKKSVLESLAESELEEVAERFADEEDDDQEEEEEEEAEEVEQKVPDAAVVAGLVAKAKESGESDVNEMEVMDPERKKARELFQPEKETSRWAFWRRPSKRDQQLARVSEGYLEMVDMVRAIRNQMDSQNENNLILRDSLAHLPEAMKGLESFSKSQRTVGKALKEIHGQLRNSGSKDQKLIESMVGFNDTLKGMDDTGKQTMKTFDRVQERMRDSDIRMENLFKNVQNSEEKVSETMVRLQRNMANMQLIFLFCFMVVIGVLVYTVMGNNDGKEKTAPAPAKQEKVTSPGEGE